MPIGQIIKTAGDAIQGYADRKVARENTDKTILANKEMAEYAYSKDLEMWNRSNKWNLDRWNEQNLYNSPEQQMERYKEAGLNPNLIYGTGTTSAGNTSLPASSQTAKYQAPRQDYNYKAGRIGSAIATYQDTRMKSAQIDQVKEQTNGQMLDNQLRQGSIAHQLAILKAQARSSGDTAEIKNIEMMEKKWSWANNIQIDKYASELVKSQMEAGIATNRKAITDWEKSLSEQGMSVSDPLWMRQGHKRGSQWWDKFNNWWFESGGGRTEFPNPWKK